MYCTCLVPCLYLYPGIVHPVCASQIPSKTTSFEYVRKHLFSVQHQEEVIVASAISGILQGMKIQSLKWQGKCHSTNCLHGKTTCCFSLEAILRFMKLPKILAIRCDRHITWCSNARFEARLGRKGNKQSPKCSEDCGIDNGDIFSTKETPEEIYMRNMSCRLRKNVLYIYNYSY